MFDSYALLALWFAEPGAELVKEALQQAGDADRPVLITAVNWADTLCQVERRQGRDGVAVARRFEQTMPLDVVAADRELADAFAVARTKQKKAVFITGDPEFKPLEGEIKIRWLK